MQSSSARHDEPEHSSDEEEGGGGLGGLGTIIEAPAAVDAGASVRRLAIDGTTLIEADGRQLNAWTGLEGQVWALQENGGRGRAVACTSSSGRGRVRPR